jgi:alpha-tubulin suppressor-like RCC1 family protein
VDTSSAIGVPTLIPTLPIKSRIENIVHGTEHSFITLRTESSLVYSFGNNIFGQLGVGDLLNRQRPELISGIWNVKHISAGSSHSLLCNSNGTLYSFGSNENGELGLLDTLYRMKPTQVDMKSIRIVMTAAGNRHSLILDDNWNVYSFGMNRVRNSLYSD